MQRNQPITIALISANSLDKTIFMSYLNNQLAEKGVKTNSLNSEVSVFNFNGSQFRILPMIGEERFSSFSLTRDRLKNVNAIIGFSATDAQFKRLETNLPQHSLVYKSGSNPIDYLTEIQKELGQAPAVTPAFKR